jgi:prevent-host-death family protein
MAWGVCAVDPASALWLHWRYQLWALEVVVEVGIRALRDELSRHLAEVRRGRTVTVTDHGRVIARIVPAGGPTALERLIGEGRVQPAKRRKRPAPEPVSATETVSDLVAEQRR